MTTLPTPAIPVDDLSDQPLHHWREQALGVLLRLTMLIALPAVVLDSMIAFQNQRIFPSIIYVAGYLLLIALTLVPRVPHQVQTYYLLGSLALIGVLELLTFGLNVAAMLFLMTFVVLSALFLGLRGAVVAGVLALLTTLFSVFLIEQGIPRTMIALLTDAVILAFLSTMLASLILTLLQSLLDSLHHAEALALAAQQAQQQAEAHAAALAVQQAAAVQARDEALQARNEAMRSRNEVQQQLAIVQQQEQVIRELSVPVLPLSASTLVLPLVGRVDVQRVQQVAEVLLENVAQHHARLVILDITGMAQVDESIAASLVQAIQAVQLLGAQVMITGIQPRTAHTLVQLGVGLDGIRTYNTLERGIAAALRQEM